MRDLASVLHTCMLVCEEASGEHSSSSILPLILLPYPLFSSANSQLPSPNPFHKKKNTKKNIFLCHSFILPPGLSKENQVSQVW